MSYRSRRLLHAFDSTRAFMDRTITNYLNVASKERLSLFGGEASAASKSRKADTSPRVTMWPAMAAVLFGASILGFGAIFVKWATAGGATPLTVGTYRMLFALPGAYWLARRTGSLGQGQGRFWAILAGFAFFADVWLWHEAMTRTSAANATLILGGLCPVWVALISAAFFGVRYGFRGWVGQAIGVAGAVLLATSRGASVDQGQGEFVAVAASLCYAVFTLLLGRSRVTLRAAQSLFWLTASAAACFVVAAIGSGDPLVGYTPQTWLSLVGLGLLVHLLAWWLNSWGLGLLDAALGALGLQAQQVGTLLLAAWLLDEPLRPLGVLGGLLIIGGIVVNAFNVRRIRVSSLRESLSPQPIAKPLPAQTSTVSTPQHIPGYGTQGRPQTSRQLRATHRAGASAEMRESTRAELSEQSRTLAETLRRRRSASWPAPVGWTMMGRFGAKAAKR